MSGTLFSAEQMAKLMNNLNSAKKYIAELEARRSETIAMCEQLQAENKRLKEGLREAMKWNWIDGDVAEAIDNKLSALVGDK